MIDRPALPTARDVLIAAGNLITPAEAWSPGRQALDAVGVPVHPGDPAAVSFSAPGAIDAAVCRLFHTRDYAAEPIWREAMDIADATVREITVGRHDGIASYDRDTHRSAILHTFDVAVPNFPD